MLNYLKRLYEHLFWADACAAESLQGSTDERSVTRFAHLLAAEQVWLTRLQETPDQAMAIWPELTIAECQSLAISNRDAYRSYLAALDDELLVRSVVYYNSKGIAFETARHDILTHVALHGSYHRGQIALSLRDAKGEPLNTDYITWVRDLNV
jgi:uncharacterized damage-inducible protein DinB